MRVGILIDETDKITPEGAVAFGSPTVKLLKNTATGVTTEVSITLTDPSPGGANDWIAIGTTGYYDVEITAAQNDTLGELQLIGTSSGVLPFWSEIYTVVSQAEYAYHCEGKRFLFEGTLAAGGTTTATLPAAAPATADFFNNTLPHFYDGTGANQAPLATDYSAGKVLTHDAVATATSTDTKVAILPQGLTGLTEAEVQSQVNAGLVALGLDHLVNAAVTGTDVTDDSIVAKLASSSATADWDDFVNTTDSLQAQRDNTGTAGAGLTDLGGMSTAMKAEVNAEVVDTLATDTYAEPGQGTPGATISLAAKINYLFKAWRNRSNQNATTYQLYNDDASTVGQKATVSDDATTAEKGEVVSGP